MAPKKEMSKDERKRKQQELTEAAEQRNKTKKFETMFKEDMKAVYAIFCETEKDEKKQEARFFEIFDNDEEELLTYFDRNRTMYGPLHGIKRITRWKRADSLGLDPPQRIKEIMDSNKAEADKICRTD